MIRLRSWLRARQGQRRDRPRGRRHRDALVLAVREAALEVGLERLAPRLDEPRPVTALVGDQEPETDHETEPAYAPRNAMGGRVSVAASRRAAAWSDRRGLLQRFNEIGAAQVLRVGGNRRFRTAIALEVAG